MDVSGQTGAGMCFSQRGKTKLSSKVCVPLWEIVYYKTGEKRAVWRAKAGTETNHKQREGARARGG